MKKREVDHVLRAAGRIMHEKQFIIVGSQSLHGNIPTWPMTSSARLKWICSPRATRRRATVSM